MFELIKNGKKDYFNICVEGITYLYSHVYYDKGEIDKPSQYVSKDKIVSQYLLLCSLEDFGDFTYLSLNAVFDWIAFEHSLDLSYEIESLGDYGKREYKKTDKIDVTFSFRPDLARWNKKFGFIDYYNDLENLFNQSEILQGKIRYYSEDGGAFDVSIVLPKFNSPLNNFLSPYITEFKTIHERVITNLELKEKKDSIVEQFEFPNQIKASCEQYLLYFATFLGDLIGIEATSSLREEAGKVLFSVTPIDDVEALDKIREALAVYLNLPSSPVLYNDSFQSMQLKQQVENLQHSQRMKEMEMRSAQYALRLAQQNIENQDKIIIQQNSFIDNQNKIIEKITSKSVMIDSLENKEELEKFCEGFEVGKSEFLIKHFGLHLNPATVLKNVGKKILGKDESKSILDLNEETNQEDN